MNGKKIKILATALGIVIIFAVWHNFTNSSEVHAYALEAVSDSGVWNAGVDEENTKKLSYINNLTARRKK